MYFSFIVDERCRDVANVFEKFATDGLRGRGELPTAFTNDVFCNANSVLI